MKLHEIPKVSPHLKFDSKQCKNWKNFHSVICFLLAGLGCCGFLSRWLMPLSPSLSQARELLAESSWSRTRRAGPSMPWSRWRSRTWSDWSRSSTSTMRRRCWQRSTTPSSSDCESTGSLTHQIPGAWGMIRWVNLSKEKGQSPLSAGNPNTYMIKADPYFWVILMDWA